MSIPFCMWLSWLIIKLSTNPPLFVLIDMLCNRYGDRQATQLWAPFIPCLYLPLSEWNKIYVMLCYVMLNVDWSSVKSSDIHIRANSQTIPHPAIIKSICKITNLKFHSNFPGVNELSWFENAKQTSMHELPSITKGFRRTVSWGILPVPLQSCL